MNAQEKRIQIALFDRYHTTWSRAFPNIYAFDWECDMLAITRSGYAIEYEIKDTYSDFKADFTKIKKHPTLKTIYGKPMLDYSTFPIISYKKAKNEKEDDGVEMTSMQSIVIGAMKEISDNFKKANDRIAALEAR